jgi:glycosyltransferase involved in cell wall biosynthesis
LDQQRKKKTFKIAVVCPNYPPAKFEGGISHYSSLLADNLRRCGHDIYALTSTQYTLTSKETRQLEGIKTIRINGPWNHMTIRKIREIISKESIDAVILQYAPASFKTSFRIKWAIAKYSCQKITAFHTLWGKGADRLIGLLMLLGSGKIIATNSEIMTILERRLPFLLNKTYWIPIGSNILPHHSNECIENSHIPLFCWFGMLYPGKGLELILDALSELKKRGLKFSFKFIGGDIIYYKSYGADLKERIQKRRLEDFVEHLGHLPVEKVSQWLNKSRFVFLPYDKGFSDRRGSFIAAVVHGKAVLTSPPVVPMPFFKQNVNVIWPNEHSTLAYVSLLEHMLTDDELISRLSLGARQLAKMFYWDKIASEHELVLRV